MPEFSQSERIIAIDTPLGPDVLLLRSFTGQEGMNSIFRVHLDMLSTNFSIDFDQIVGKNVTIRIRLEDDSERFLNGFISRFAQLPVEGHLAHYEAEMVPWLWFLTRTADCKIFQEKAVPDIISAVFDEFGFSDYELQIQGSHPERTYCVQYRETAANFVMRLLEEEGIFFYFRHEESKHIMVIGDAPSVHQPCPAQSEVRFEHSVGRGAEQGEDVIFEWRTEHHLRPGKYAITDYNFEMPATDLMSTIVSTINQGGNRKYEIYDYPGEYSQRSEGETIVRNRIEEEETPHEVATGESNCRSLAVGHKFELTEHDRNDQNREYVLTSVTHSAHSGSFVGGTQGEGASYANSFSAIPSDIPYRPLRKTPQPLVEGCQSAVVVGPSGEEIYVDKYGRVKVQFHWDRLGRKDENSSCWIRVSQPWAGKNWGGVYLPRIGQEVLVDFLEGDPDRPIITGRVYNAVQATPYPLPANQTVSTMKSRSSKGGGTSNFNEIRFEDKKGKEQIFIHAEKDVDEIVKNDSREHIGHSRHLVVKKDQIEKVEENKHLTVVGSQTEQVAQDKHQTVGGDHNQKVDGTVSLEAGMDYQQKTGMKHAVDSGMEIHLKAGMNVVIEAGLQISLVGAGGFIDIGPGGVTIQGILVNINSGGAAGSGSGSSPTSPKTPEEPDKAHDGIGGSSGGGGGAGGGGGGAGGGGAGGGGGGGAGGGGGQGGGSGKGTKGGSTVPGKGSGDEQSKGKGSGDEQVKGKGSSQKGATDTQPDTGSGKGGGGQAPAAGAGAKGTTGTQSDTGSGKGGGGQAPAGGAGAKGTTGTQSDTGSGKGGGGQAPAGGAGAKGTTESQTDAGSSKGGGQSPMGGPGAKGGGGQSPVGDPGAKAGGGQSPMGDPGAKGTTGTQSDTGSGKVGGGQAPAGGAGAKGTSDTQSDTGSGKGGGGQAPAGGAGAKGTSDTQSDTGFGKGGGGQTSHD